MLFKHIYDFTSMTIIDTCFPDRCDLDLAMRSCSVAVYFIGAKQIPGNFIGFFIIVAFRV